MHPRVGNHAVHLIVLGDVGDILVLFVEACFPVAVKGNTHPAFHFGKFTYARPWPGSRLSKSLFHPTGAAPC